MGDDELRAWLLYKLKRKGCWGTGHVSADNLVKGQDPQLKKRILKIAEKMTREGYLIRFPHTGGIHYYLNKEFQKEIYRIIEEFGPKRI